jgi:hypothetical protein
MSLAKASAASRDTARAMPTKADLLNADLMELFPV